MLRFIYGNDLAQEPTLADAMFRDRADQFAARLGWDVSVDHSGHERDAYDALNPLYVISVDAHGRHMGSMRLLPTVGRVMVNEVFGHLLPNGPVRNPKIWECTRFCIGRNAGPEVAAALMLAGGAVIQGFGLARYVGVFDARMVRIYRAIGASPEMLGSQGAGRDRISAGLWRFSTVDEARVAARAGIAPEKVRTALVCDMRARAMRAAA